MKRSSPYLIAGAVLVAVFGSRFAVEAREAFLGPRDRFWTGQAARLPMDAFGRYCELYVTDELVQRHAARGALLLLGEDGTPRPISVEDLTGRVNSWPEVYADRLEGLLVPAAAAGLGLGLLIAGLGRGGGTEN